MNDLEKAVVEAARAWRREVLATGDEVSMFELASHVDALEASLAPNKPTGFTFTRTWAEVPAGWFVQGPGTPGRGGPPAPWFEVLATRPEDGKQWVTLDVAGKVGEWPRDPAGAVRVRKGSLAVERDAAIDALRAELGAVTVIRDEGQFS